MNLIKKLSVTVGIVLILFFTFSTTAHAIWEDVDAKTGKEYGEKIINNEWDATRYAYSFDKKTRVHVTITVDGGEYLPENDENEKGFDYWDKKNYIYFKIKNYSHEKKKSKKIFLDSENSEEVIYENEYVFKPGETDIYCYDSRDLDYFPAFPAYYKVTVKEVPATSVEIDKEKNVYVGKSKKIKLKVLEPTCSGISTVKWSTSNKKIATVDKKGNVTGVKAGKCKITCELENGKKYTCNVVVKTPPIIFLDAYFHINTVGGVEPRITIENNVKKTIKYVYLDTKYYNTVGDPAYCEIARVSKRKLTVVGPLKSGKKETYYWDPVIYNSNTGKMKITTVTVEYMDGTKSTININKSYKEYY